MINVEEALHTILAKTKPLPARKLPLLEALGCVLAEDVIASESLPPFTNSAMDGYAFLASDAKDGIAELEVIDELPAGTPSQHRVISGSAVKIMTGAPVPQGADAVVPVEQTTIPSSGRVRIQGKVRTGQHIRPAGEEAQPGDRMLLKGRVLKPADLGLLASMGITQIPVIPKPKVSVITTGSEVVDPRQTPGPGQIRNSNLTSIIASVLMSGGLVTETGHVADDPALFKDVVSHITSDVLITCGGVSVGDYDFVKPVLSQCGEIYFWKVAIKPGKPFVFGRIGESWVFGLPGNPVSGLVGFEILVKPALHALAGLPMTFIPEQTATLLKPIRHTPGRREYVRAKVHQNGKGLAAEPLLWQGSGMLRSLTEANAWIVVPEESETLLEGTAVQVMMR